MTSLQCLKQVRFESDHKMILYLKIITVSFIVCCHTRGIIYNTYGTPCWLRMKPHLQVIKKSSANAHASRMSSVARWLKSHLQLADVVTDSGEEAGATFPLPDMAWLRRARLSDWVPQLPHGRAKVRRSWGRCRTARHSLQRGNRTIGNLLSCWHMSTAGGWLVIVLFIFKYYYYYF